MLCKLIDEYCKPSISSINSIGFLFDFDILRKVLIASVFLFCKINHLGDSGTVHNAKGINIEIDAIIMLKVLWFRK